MIPGLSAYSVVLASSSPRRQELLSALKIPFEVRVIPVEEIFPEGLVKQEITDYLAVLKASPFKSSILAAEIIITADTIVWFEDQVLGKPKDANDAVSILRSLSDKWHEVYTSICFTTLKEQHVVHAKTEVKMAFLSPEEIRFYVEQGNPLDKVGAYGIQEWIGMAGIEEIRGSYTNVVGLPTQILYKTLRAMV